MIRRRPRPKSIPARRSAGQRFIIGLNALGLIAAVTMASSLAYGNLKVSDIDRVVIPPGGLREPKAKGDTTNFLLVGVDNAKGLPDDDPAARESQDNLTDTIMVLRLDPKKESAQILSFPRDLYVSIPGQRSKSRINSAYERGGPPLLIKTISTEFDIPIDHFIGVDFAGFRELVNIAEGIPVYFPHPTRSFTPRDGRGTVELNIPTAGCWRLGERQALGFSRVRKDYQVQDSAGKWHTDLGGDFTRIERQHLFIQSSISEARKKAGGDPRALAKLINLGVGRVQLDDSLAPSTLIELGRSFQDFEPENLKTYTIPTTTATSGPSYEFIVEDKAEPILALFREKVDSGASPVANSEVSVQVRNGTGEPHQATDVAGDVGKVGFKSIGAGPDALAATNTTITYTKDGEAKARLLASWIAGPVKYELAAYPAEVDLVLITGADWAGLRDEPRPYASVVAPTLSSTTPSSSTTVPASSTTVAVSRADAANGHGRTAMGHSTVNDPNSPAFYRASEPPKGADCKKTD